MPESIYSMVLYFIENVAQSARKETKVKRIAFFLAAALFCPLLLFACAPAESASGFPDDLDFVVVGQPPDGGALSTGDSVFVSALFFQDGAPMRTVPVCLSAGGTWIFADLTDAYGRLACGGLPAGEDVLFCVSPAEGETLYSDVYFAPSSAQGFSPAPDGAAFVQPDETQAGIRMAELLFLTGNGVQTQSAHTFSFDPLHLYSGVVLYLS